MNPVKLLFKRPRWHNLPMLPRMYSTEWDASQVDRETATLMKLTQTRCPQGVEILKRRYRANTHQELLKRLPSRRRKRQPLGRAGALVRRAFGLSRHDPMKGVARRHMRRGAR
jgi:hypothetical protein